jgi:hypothetical protein
MWHELDQEALAREDHAFATPRTPGEVEQIVVFVRLELYNRNRPCGAAALQQHLRNQCNLRPLPSRRRISQILVQYGLTHGRTGWYEGEDLDWLPATSRISKEERRAL